MPRDKGLVHESACLPIWLCILFVLAASQAPAMLVSIDGIDVRKVPALKAYVTVTSDSGETIKGLRAENFSVKDDIIDAGPAPKVSPLTVRSALESGESLGVVLVIDRSGSMAGAPLADAKAAAREFLTRLGVSDKAALVSFSTEARVDCNATTNRDTLTNAIKRLAVGGDTALYDAARRGAHLAAQMGGVTRRAVVVLTDGQRTHGAAGPDGAITVAKDQAVRFYTIGLGRQPNHAALERMAKETGGGHFKATSSGDLMRVYQKIADRLQNQYVLKFSRDSDLRFHRLHVTVQYRGYRASDDMPYRPFMDPAARTALSVPEESPPPEQPQPAPPEDTTPGQDVHPPPPPEPEPSEEGAEPPADGTDWITVATVAVVVLLIVLMVAIVAVVARRR